MACALHGGIIPPVSVYHRLDENRDGEIANGHILHETKPLEPMSEEEAIEYLIEKDIPAHVWKQKSGNAIRLVVCKKNQIPASRQWRNAWKINQETINDNHLH